MKLSLHRFRHLRLLAVPWTSSISGTIATRAIETIDIEVRLRLRGYQIVAKRFARLVPARLRFGRGQPEVSCQQSWIVVRLGVHVGIGKQRIVPIVRAGKHKVDEVGLRFGAHYRCQRFHAVGHVRTENCVCVAGVFNRFRFRGKLLYWSYRAVLFPWLNGRNLHEIARLCSSMFSHSLLQRLRTRSNALLGGFLFRRFLGVCGFLRQKQRFVAVLLPFGVR